MIQPWAKKPKPCKSCGELFVKRKAMQQVCGLECAIAESRRKAQEVAYKEQKQRDAKTKDRIKTRSEWIREAQVAFNRYIRARDHGKGCISSGRLYDSIEFGGKMDAGHYRSRGAAGHLRFNLLNCWAQSVKDNRNLSGNTVEYRKRLIERIGLERVERLENDNAPRTFDIEYLRRLKKLMNKRARYYEKRRTYD